MTYGRECLGLSCAVACANQASRHPNSDAGADSAQMSLFLFEFCDHRTPAGQRTQLSAHSCLNERMTSTELKAWPLYELARPRAGCGHVGGGKGERLEFVQHCWPAPAPGWLRSHSSQILLLTHECGGGSLIISAHFLAFYRFSFVHVAACARPVSVTCPPYCVSARSKTTPGQPRPALKFGRKHEPQGSANNPASRHPTNGYAK